MAIHNEQTDKQYGKNVSKKKTRNITMLAANDGIRPFTYSSTKANTFAVIDYFFRSSIRSFTHNFDSFR